MELVNTSGTEEYNEQSYHPIYRIAAKLSFFLFTFFVFFGTKIPFQEKTRDIEDMTTSNIMNQVVFTSVFLISCFGLLPKLKEIGRIILKEKMLAIFLLWCLLSIGWSDYSFVSFKRWFQILTAVVVILSVMVHIKQTDDLLKYFKIILSAYIILNIVSIFTIPLAKDSLGSWRGLSSSKNFLGQAALTGALIFVYAIRKSGWIGKIFYWMMLMISLIILKGSDSSTSLLVFIIIALVWFLFFIDKQFKDLGTGRFLSIATITAVVSIAVLAVVMIPDRVNAALGLIGEDLTFTGRTEIWEDIMIEVAKHPILGAGFQGFWVLSNTDLIRIYDIYIWLPQQAHNGYVDLLNEVGIIGVLLLFGLIIWYFINLVNLKTYFYWNWFIIAALLINLQESTLFRPGVITGIMFIFAYIALFVELDNQRREEYEEIYQVGGDDIYAENNYIRENSKI